MRGTMGLFFLILMEHRLGRGAGIKNGPKINFKEKNLKKSN